MLNSSFPRPASFLNYVQVRARKVHSARRFARLQRELARLPRYIADDIGIGPSQEYPINFVDD